MKKKKQENEESIKVLEKKIKQESDNLCTMNCYKSEKGNKKIGFI